MARSYILNDFFYAEVLHVFGHRSFNFKILNKCGIHNVGHYSALLFERCYLVIYFHVNQLPQFRNMVF